MHWRPVLLLAAIGIIIVAGILSHPPIALPGPPPELQHAPSPLEITLDLIPDPSNPAAWLTNSSTPKIPFYLHYRNVSDRDLLISAHSFAIPDIHFACASWLSSPANIFFTDNGEICWLIIHPGETVTSTHDMANYLNFKTGGTYNINYAITLQGSYAARPAGSELHGPSNKFLLPDFQKFSTGSFKAYTSGQLPLPIR